MPTHYPSWTHPRTSAPLRLKFLFSFLLLLITLWVLIVPPICTLGVAIHWDVSKPPAAMFWGWGETDAPSSTANDWGLLWDNLRQELLLLWQDLTNCPGGPWIYISCLSLLSNSGYRLALQDSSSSSQNLPKCLKAKCPNHEKSLAEWYGGGGGVWKQQRRHIKRI